MGAFPDPMKAFWIHPQVSTNFAKLLTLDTDCLHPYVSWPRKVVRIGVLLRFVWLNIDGTGLDGLYSIYQGHLVFQKGQPMVVPFLFRGRNLHITSSGGLERLWRLRRSF